MSLVPPRIEFENFFRPSTSGQPTEHLGLRDRLNMAPYWWLLVGLFALLLLAAVWWRIRALVCDRGEHWASGGLLCRLGLWRTGTD